MPQGERHQGPRLPVQPLLDAAGTVTVDRVERHWRPKHSSWEVGGVAALSMRTGIAKRQLDRYRVIGIPWIIADEIACALGLHPLEVWPDFYELIEVSA